MFFFSSHDKYMYDRLYIIPRVSYEIQLERFIQKYLTVLIDLGKLEFDEADW